MSLATKRTISVITHIELAWRAFNSLLFVKIAGGHYYKHCGLCIDQQVRSKYLVEMMNPEYLLIDSLIFVKKKSKHRFYVF